MKNNSEKETKKKRGKSIGCGCLSIFVLGFILIGIFADDPKPENENSEQKTESTVATKQEQIKTEVSKAASTPEKEESATDNIKIPMSENLESLNAGVSGSIIMSFIHSK